MFSSRLSILSAAGLALALLGPATPAHAAGAGTVIGTGVLSPGIPLTGCEEQTSIQIAATAVFAGTDFAPGVYAFSFDGASTICESVGSGQGVGNLSGDITGSVAYTRTGGLLLASGTISVQGSPAIPVEIRCVVVVTVNTEGVIVEFTKYCYVTVSLV